MNSFPFIDHLQHWPAILCAFIPLLINLGIFIYVFFFLPKSKMNVPFLLFLTILCTWQFNDTIVRLSTTVQVAQMWFDVLIIPINFIAPFALHFALVFTEKEKLLNSPWVLSMLYLPAIMFSFLTIGGVISHDTVHSDYWSWMFTFSQDPLSQINGIWIGGLMLFTLVLLTQYTFYSKNLKVNKYRQAVLITIGMAIPSIQGIITELIFPTFLQMEPIPITTASMSVFSICTIIALSRYSLLSYSPQHAWKNIIRNMNEGLIIVDNEDKIQYANNKFTRITGYEESELLGKVASEVFLEEGERQKISEMIDRRKEHLSDVYEIHMRTKSGDKIWVSISGSPYFENKGQVVGSVGIIADQTEQKKAEMAIQESEEFFRTFMEESLLAIYMYDPQAKTIIKANQSFSKLLGYSQNEIGDLDISDFCEHSEKQLDVLLRNVKSKKNQVIGERQWKNKNGQIINVFVTTNHITYGGKDIIVFTAQDITQMKQLEAQLQVKVNDLNMFVYRSSHDLRGPLASITGIVNLAKIETGMNKEMANRYIDMIATSTKRLEDILNDLSDIAQITEKKVELKPVSFASEFKQIVSDLRGLPNFQKVQVDINVDQDEEHLVDQRLLLAIMQNLIANAINYADLRKQSPYVTIEAKTSSAYTLITVSDNGVGIPEEYQEKIFDMFYRANEDSEGTGLGLFILRNALEKLGGKVELKSEKGKGSTFTILLPNKTHYLEQKAS